MPKKELVQNGPQPNPEINAPINTSINTHQDANATINTNANVTVNANANPQMIIDGNQGQVAGQHHHRSHNEKKKKKLLEELAAKSTDAYKNKMRKLMKDKISGYNRDRINYVGSLTGEAGYAEEYHTAYRETKNANKRTKAINNSKSRLYKKARNKEAISGIENKVEKINEGFQQMVMNKNMLGDPNTVPEEEMNERKEVMKAFSAFTTVENEKNNYAAWSKQMVTYLGLDDDLKYLESDQKEALKEKRQQGVMDTLTTEILKENLSDIELFSDTMIAANAKKFEQLKKKTDAYSSLARGAATYFKDRGEGLRTEVEEKIRKIKLICEYYDIRKEIIRDPHYSTHYNHELTMQAETVDKKLDPDKYELSKKLLKSYYLGLAISDNHLGGSASMVEIAPFRHLPSQRVREAVKSEVSKLTGQVMSFTITYSSKNEKAKEFMKSGVRESNRKRWINISESRDYGRNLKNIARQAKREGTGTLTETEKIYTMNHLNVISEGNEDEDDGDDED